VKQVAYQAEKPQASGKDDQLILSAEFGEDVLLILLDCNPSARVKEIRKKPSHIPKARTASPEQSDVRVA
jgi:hypothetical protein